MEKAIVLHNILCYKYVYFYCTWCNQNGKKHRKKIVDIILPAGDGEYDTRREKKNLLPITVKLLQLKRVAWMSE